MIKIGKIATGEFEDITTDDGTSTIQLSAYFCLIKLASSTPAMVVPMAPPPW